ncbi:MAG: hypothetical protein ACKPE3_13280 [Sphaerospermopsis kisseleviana]
MKTVQLPKKHLSTIVNKLAQFPLCYERFKFLNVQWEDCTIEAGLFEPEQPGVQGKIPHITYEDKLQTTSMEYERDEFGNSDEAVAEYGEYLYLLLDALSTYNPILSGRTTPSLGSFNDYQRGRD